LAAIGENTSNNDYDSSSVVQNADGSILERLEYIQQNIIPDVGGLVFRGTCDSGMTASTTTIVCADLSGYGDDFFNDKYYMQVIKNANSVGNAPETQVRQITDYVSTSGTFTVSAFGANVEENDEILVLHETLVTMGRNDTNNAISTSSVTANEDGSILERLEHIQSAVNVGSGSGLNMNNSLVDVLGVDGSPASLSGDIDGISLRERIDALILAMKIVSAGMGDGFEEDGTGGTLYDIFNSTDANGNVFSMNGGTAYNDNIFSFLKEIGKYIADGDGDFATGTSLPSDASLYDILAGPNGIPTFPAASAPGNAVSLAEVIRAIYENGPRNTMVNRDMPYLVEFWETESLDPGVWEVTLDGAGTGAVAEDSGYIFYDLDTEAVLGSDVFINTKYRWQTRPSVFGDTNCMIRKLILEFEARLTGTIANHDNQYFIMGFSATKSNYMGNNNIAAFILQTDDIATMTDKDGTDEIKTIASPPTATNWNKYRIEVYGTGYKFYVNETLVNTHETQVPNEAMYIVFGARAESANTVGLDVGNVRAWYEEVI